MNQFNMLNFKYAEGNKVEFEGFFGRVELIYRETTTEQWDLTNETDAINVPSHFSAYLFTMESANPLTSASAETAESAVMELYIKYAAYRALEDTGALHNNPQNQ